MKPVNTTPIGVAHDRNEILSIAGIEIHPLRSLARVPTKETQTPCPTLAAVSLGNAAKKTRFEDPFFYSLAKLSEGAVADLLQHNDDSEPTAARRAETSHHHHA
jgi:hypothetical protein